MTRMTQPSPYGVPPNTPRHGPQWGAVPQRPQVSTGDKAISIALMVVAPFVCAAASFWGVFSILGTGECGSDCGLAVDLAIPTMIFAPWVIWLVASVWAIVRLIRKKSAIWVMVTGLCVSLVVYVAANMMMFAAVG